MGDIAIRVSGLSKLYRIGVSQKRANTLRDALTGTIAGVARSLRGHSDQPAGDTIWALKDVSFEVKRGEVLGVIGRNGAGKSTLLKILSRITEPTCGEVDIYGRVGSLLEVGTGFHPELTGRENIYLNGAVLGMGRREVKRKFDEIIAFADVEKFLDTPVKHYSSGMYMRLAFAVAAHLEPEILVVDEVLAVGDAEFQKKCLGKMSEVAGEGRTVLFVSHNIAAVQNLCQSAMLLGKGRLAGWGAPLDVIARYLQRAPGPAQTVITRQHSRQGTADIQFKAVRLLNASGEVVSALLCGEIAIFAVVYENRLNQDLHNLHLSVGIDNYLGERIAILNSEMTGENFANVPANSDCIEIHIDRLPLAPGRYGYTLFSSLNGIIADWIQNAGSFDVEAGDYYRTGKLPPPSQGMFLVDHHFCLGQRVEVHSL